MKRLRQESDDKSRQLHELHDVKAKVAHDLTEVTGRLKSLESSSEGATREKSKLLQEIEVLKMSVEEAEAVGGLSFFGSFWVFFLNFFQGFEFFCEFEFFGWIFGLFQEVGLFESFSFFG